MSFNGNVRKHGALAATCGGIMALIIFSVLLNTLQLDPIAPTKSLGMQIAQRMEAAEGNISYLWSSNNTWVNQNISENYPQYIDGVHVGFENEMTTMALIHAPTADLAEISRQDLNNVMANFRNSISVLNGTATTNFTLNIELKVNESVSIYPFTFVIDIAYEDGTFITIKYIQYWNLVYVVNGTWVLSDITHFGIKQIIPRSSKHTVFFTVTDSTLIMAAIQSFANLIYATFP